jgi:hypothetical protein
VRRLRLFAKGNVDVRDSLLYSRVGEAIAWNGINEIVREQFPNFIVRVQHEVWSRSDALLAAQGTIPADLFARNPRPGFYSLESQFSRKLFTIPSDALVLSIQPDVTNLLCRHRHDGYLFFPSGCQSWPAEERVWLHENFEVIDRLDVSSSMDGLARICREVRSRLDGDVPILIYNLSPVMPGELIDCHQGLGEILSTRIRRFNLGLIELSQQLGVCVVDVDTIVARGGADRLKIDPVHLTAEGSRLVAAEVVRILHDHGCFDET